MTSRREVIQNFNPNVRRQGIVTITDSYQLRIEGEGITVLQPNQKNTKEIRVQKVLYNTELNNNLISVSSITKKKGCNSWIRIIL